MLFRSMQAVFNSNSQTQIRSVDASSIETANEPMSAHVVTQERERLRLQHIVPSHHRLGLKVSVTDPVMRAAQPGLEIAEHAVDARPVESTG